jgi:hypothetical protein
MCWQLRIGAVYWIMHWLSFEEIDSRRLRRIRFLSSPNSEAAVDTADVRVLSCLESAFTLSFAAGGVLVMGFVRIGLGFLAAPGGIEERGVEL